MGFAVTVFRVRNRSLEELGALINQTNVTYGHVNSPVWNEPLRQAWNVWNQGEPIEVSSAHGTRHRVIITYPEIHRAKLERSWWDENHELVDYRDRVNVYGKETIFFEDGDSVLGAVFASSKSSDTKWVVKTLLEPIAEVELAPDDFCVPDDMIYWLLCRYRGGQRQIGTVQLGDVRGYLGETDNGHKVRGQGARILSHLSTLGLVAENEPLRSVEIEAIVGPNRVVFSVYDDGSCSIDENSRCDFARVPNTHEQQLLLVLFVYTQVLPVLKQEYQYAIRANAWTRNARLAFVRDVAMDLSRLAHARA